MRINKKYYAIALSTIALGVLASCSNDLSEPGKGEALSSAINLVKAPEVQAFSGGNAIGVNGVTAATRAEGYPSFLTYCTTGHENDKNSWAYAWTPSGTYDLSKYYDYMPKSTGRGQSGRAVSQSEADYVFDWLDKNSDKGYTVATVPSVYFFQCVGANTMTYDWNGNGAETYTMNSLVLNEDYTDPYNASSHAFGYSYTGNNTGHVQGELVLCANYPIVNPSYDHTNGVREYDAYKFYYITLPEDVASEDAGKTCLYIGFDFRANKGAQVTFPGNGKYYDWVMKIVPADGTVITNPDAVVDPDPEAPDAPVDPTDPDAGDEIDTPAKDIPEHVEVNLSIEERFNYLTSHLSIHVRAVTDVEVFVPIPAEFVCEADDLAIVQKHQDDLMVHGGPTSQSYQINGETVTLTINVEASGIRVTTSGINENVISYLKEKYDDGMTFEVWNYMNITHSQWIDMEHSYLDLETLKGYMNRSTIKFLTKAPELYVNAFMYETGDAEYHEGHEGIFCDDCTVTPFDANLYDSQETNWFYNNSPYNELYYNKVSAE